MNAQIRDVQLVQLEMLHEFDRICRKYGISYTLFAGTALGAVRHGGFIPWDDDLDVLMLRPEYERFLALAPAMLDERYFLQAEFSAHWPMHFSKLRKNHTTFLERQRPRDMEMHQGVYIDIFPCDDLSPHAAVAGLQFLASKVVIAKALSRRGYLTDSPVKKAFVCLCRLLPATPFRRLAQLRRESDSPMVHSFFAASSRYRRSVFPREWITQTVPMAFEDGQFPVSSHVHALLTTLYGDYLTPLPETERECKVHGVLVDLQKPYTDYLEVQKQMKFTQYTRSIR